MPSRTHQAETDRRPASLLHTLHASRNSLHIGIARTPVAPTVSTRPGDRPIHPGDLAQSRLFEALLLDELDELDGLLAAAERRWDRQRQRDSRDGVVVPKPLLRLRERIKEVSRLLDALNKRFPGD